MTERGASVSTHWTRIRKTSCSNPGADPSDRVFFVVFLSHQWARCGKALDHGLDGPGWIQGVGEVEIFLHFFVSRLVPGVHSGSYKMSTGELYPGVNAFECRTSHPTSS